MSKSDNDLYSITASEGVTTLRVNTRSGARMRWSVALFGLWLLCGWQLGAGILIGGASLISPSLLVNADGDPSPAGIGAIALVIVFEIWGLVQIRKMASKKKAVSVAFGPKALTFNQKQYDYGSILSFGWEGPGRQVMMTVSTGGIVQGLNNAAQAGGVAIGNVIGSRSFGVYILCFGKKVFLYKGLKEPEAESVFLETKRILADRGVYFS